MATGAWLRAGKRVKAKAAVQNTVAATLVGSYQKVKHMPDDYYKARHHAPRVLLLLQSPAPSIILPTAPPPRPPRPRARRARAPSRRRLRAARPRAPWRPLGGGYGGTR